MTFIVKNGVVFEQTLSEVDIEVEKEKLKTLKEILISDETERKEREEKVAEIKSVVLSEEMKEKLIASITFSDSGFKQKDVDEQQTKVDEINRLLKKK